MKLDKFYQKLKKEYTCIHVYVMTGLDFIFGIELVNMFYREFFVGIKNSC